MKGHLKVILGLALFSIFGVILTSTSNASGDPLATAATTVAIQSIPSGAVAYFPLNSATGVSGKATTSSFITSPCILKPQNIYLRNSGGIGTKSVTDCTVPVTSIHQDIYLEKQSELGYWEQVGPLFSAYNNNVSSLTQTNASVACTNAKTTNWNAVTKGIVVYQGITFIALSTAQNGPQLYNCGT
jgi:hypothetical protein